MADTKTFGPRLHTYTHADAIEDGVLADYQLVVPTITDTHLRTVITTPRHTPASALPHAAPPRCTWRFSKR